MGILIIILIAFEITNIIVYGDIFEFIRGKLKNTFIGDLIHCPMCTSVWVGAFLSILLGGIVDEYIDLPNKHFIIETFLDMMFIGGSVYVVYTLIDYFESKS